MTFKKYTKLNLKKFGNSIIKILNGTTIAIVVALIPNAVLGSFFNLFPDNEIVQQFSQICVFFQYFTAIMAGFLVALQFKCSGMQAACVGGATCISSGAWSYIEVFIEQTNKNIYNMYSIGDIINIMLIAGIAVAVVKIISPKLGSLNIILLPIIVVIGVGFFGTLTYIPVTFITKSLGILIESFTNLQPILSCVLISISFAILIVSPISTVAIGMAINLSGISSAAAGMGIAATTAYLVWATARVNKKGVPVAIALGGMKMMMTNFLTHPIIAIPISIIAIISSISVPLTNMMGTPSTAGFGLVGLVCPLAALKSSDIGVLGMILYWIVIPFTVAFIVNKIFCDVVHLYKKEIFEFKAKI